MAQAVVDTNIILRHITGDDSEMSPRATALFGRIEAGTERVRLPETAVLEAVYALEKLYRQTRRDIRNNLMPIIDLPGIVLRAKAGIRDAFELYIAFPRLSFADCYHAQIALDEEGEILSFDRGLDRVPGLKRIEP